MLIENSKIVVLKLGSSTVVDNKGKFKKKWVTSLIKDIKSYDSKIISKAGRRCIPEIGTVFCMLRT